MVTVKNVAHAIHKGKLVFIVSRLNKQIDIANIQLQIHLGSPHT